MIPTSAPFHCNVLSFLNWPKKLQRNKISEKRTEYFKLKSLVLWQVEVSKWLHILLLLASFSFTTSLDASQLYASLPFFLPRISDSNVWFVGLFLLQFPFQFLVFQNAKDFYYQKYF